MIEERLLGFDVREAGGGPEDLWDANRRNNFLLRAGAVKPLSVDTAVWPSVFDTGQGIGMSKEERERLHFAGVPVTGYTGMNAGLWEDVLRMRRHLNEQWAKPQTCVEIAISWFSDRGFSNAGRYGPYLERTSPAERDLGWEFLGFDVADGSLISGLSNCGYLPEEAQSLRAQWLPRLNENHLFNDFNYVVEFCDLTDRRVPSHAPFFVYGLYLMGAFT